MCVVSAHRQTYATNAMALPIVIYRLIPSDVILELSGRIKVLDCQEMGFFLNKKIMKE